MKWFKNNEKVDCKICDIDDLKKDVSDIKKGNNDINKKLDDIEKKDQELLTKVIDKMEGVIKNIAEEASKAIITEYGTSIQDLDLRVTDIEKKLGIERRKIRIKRK